MADHISVDESRIFAASFLTRVVTQFLVHTLSAINKYFVSDKYASRIIEQFAF